MLKVNDWYDCYQVFRTNSSFITSFSFYFNTDEETGEVIDKEYGYLLVVIDGINYYFNDFPVSRFFAMTNAESVGAFFNAKVKGFYPLEII